MASTNTLPILLLVVILLLLGGLFLADIAFLGVAGHRSARRDRSNALAPPTTVHLVDGARSHRNRR